MMTRRRLMLALLVATLGLTPACTKIYTDDREGAGASPTAPTPMPVPVVKTDKIEFRVLGSNLSTVPPVVMRHTDAVNGLSLYSGGVPYFVQFDSTSENVFLYIEAQATGNLFTSTLQVQIYVNGKLFREGFASGFTLNAQASGTYRR